MNCFSRVLLFIYITFVNKFITRRNFALFYKLISIPYDATITLFLPAYYDVAKEFVEVNIPFNSVVLDICCGTGNLALMEAHKASVVVGLDISEKMLENAFGKSRRMSVNNLCLVCADIKDRLPFKDGVFDVVSAGNSVPSKVSLYYEHSKNAMSEAYRVLRSGGRLIILTGCPSVSEVYLSREEYITLLGGVGFRDVSVEERGRIYSLVTAIKR